MITGVTSSGFAFELDDNAADNYEILDALVKIDRGESTRIVDVVDSLLGEEQKEKLMEHIRNEKGRVSASGMIKETFEIFEKCKEIKNS